MELEFKIKSYEGKQYQGIRKEVKIRGKTHEAYFPKEHSLVEGIIISAYNSSESCNQLSRYTSKCYVKWKHKENWQKIFYEFTGDKVYVRINQKKVEGHYPVLFELESNGIRKNHLQKIEKSRLEKSIEKDLNRLKDIEVKK